MEIECSQENFNRLSSRMKETVYEYADRVEHHRYAFPLTITSAFRENDPRAHGDGEAIDFRGPGHPRMPPGFDESMSEEDRWKYRIWLGAMWADVCRTHGYGAMQWGFEVEIHDDLHCHADTRSYTNLWAAVWFA